MKKHRELAEKMGGIQARKDGEQRELGQKGKEREQKNQELTAKHQVLKQAKLVMFRSLGLDIAAKFSYGNFLNQLLH